MLIIRETTGSDLGPETGYPDRFFMLFPSSFVANTCEKPEIRPRSTFSVKPF
jgi:hypothetical protein